MSRYLSLAAACALSSGAPVLAASPPLAVGQEAPQTRGLYLQLIHQARADGRPRAALAYLDDFERQFPGDVGAEVLRVNSLIDLGQIDQAERALAVLAKTSSNAAVDAVRGHVAAARGRWTDAAGFYQLAANASPADPLLRNALGYALLRSDRGDAAIEQLHAAGDLAPTDMVIRNNLLLALAMTGRKADLAAEIARSGDRQAQTDLLRSISSEASRLGALRPTRKANS
jgi:Flp pilus assembly protein TadD